MSAHTGIVRPVVRALVAATAMVFAVSEAAADAWDGFYVGTPAGGVFGWATYDADAIAGDASGVGGFPIGGFSLGIFGGGYVGYGWQRGRFVAGVEAGAGIANADGQTECGNGVDRGYLCYTTLQSYARLNGFVGLVGRRSFTSLRVGIAWGRQHIEVREPSVPEIWGATDTSGFGWTIGIGNEQFITPNVSVRTALDYVRFPERTVTLGSVANPDTQLTTSQHYLLASIGVIYRPGADGLSEGAVLGGSRAQDTIVGRRLWLSFGALEIDRFDIGDPSVQTAALTVDGYVGFGGESYSRSRTPRGFFQRFAAGVGPVAGGTLLIEGPDATTISMLERGRMLYRINDYGYYFLNGERGSLGFFVGTTWMLEIYRAFGCEQIGGGTPVCNPAIPGAVDYQTNTLAWVAPRFGLAGEISITDRLTFRADAALSPRVRLWNIENQWHAPDGNPAISTGTGFGYQVGGELNYAFSDRFRLGTGVRYWAFHAGGMFDHPVTPELHETTSRHFNFFVEVAFDLGGERR